MKQDRNSRIYEFQGENLTIAEIARRLGMKQNTLWARLNRMTAQEAFSRPVRGKRG